jgi:hypothetical protein
VNHGQCSPGFTHMLTRRCMQRYHAKVSVAFTRPLHAGMRARHVRPVQYKHRAVQTSRRVPSEPFERAPGFRAASLERKRLGALEHFDAFHVQERASERTAALSSIGKCWPGRGAKKLP